MATVLSVIILALDAVAAYIKSDFRAESEQIRRWEVFADMPNRFRMTGDPAPRASGDPSKRGSFDLKSPSDVAGYGIRQRSFAPVEVPVSRGKGSRRRPFSPFLEFYLSGVGYLRLRWGIRGRGYNTGKAANGCTALLYTALFLLRHPCGSLVNFG